MRRLIAILATVASLSACASAPTLYQPAGGPKAVGFSEYRIESDRFRVTFRGGPGAPQEQVADYALLRAAELTIGAGYDWFRVVERGTQVVGGGSGPRLSLGTGGTDFGRHSAVGVGVGTSFDLSGGPALAYTVEILLGKGPAPRGGDVYVAREVERSIRNRT
jgi:hypothetical protein